MSHVTVKVDHNVELWRLGVITGTDSFSYGRVNKYFFLLWVFNQIKVKCLLSLLFVELH
jgi:hypothetical protein